MMGITSITLVASDMALAVTREDIRGVTVEGTRATGVGRGTAIRLGMAVEVVLGPLVTTSSRDQVPGMVTPPTIRWLIRAMVTIPSSTGPMLRMESSPMLQLGPTISTMVDLQQVSTRVRPLGKADLMAKHLSTHTRTTTPSNSNRGIHLLNMPVMAITHSLSSTSQLGQQQQQQQYLQLLLLRRLLWRPWHARWQ